MLHVPCHIFQLFIYMLKEQICTLYSQYFPTLTPLVGMGRIFESVCLSVCLFGYLSAA